MTKDGRPVKYRAQSSTLSAKDQSGKSKEKEDKMVNLLINTDGYSCDLENQNPNICNGLLKMLPNELLYHVFTNLSIEDLGVVSLASKEMRNRVYQYVFGSRVIYKRFFTSSCFNKDDTFHFDPCNADLLFRFEQIGIFLKRLTILDSTDARIKLICTFIRTLRLQIEFHNCTSTNYQLFKFRFRCLGKLVQTFVLGWDESEIKRLFNVLEQSFSVNFLMKKFFRVSNGSQRLLEYYIRYFYRMVFFDSQRFVSDKAYWINYVLNQYCLACHQLLKMIEVARLLILFFGPLIGHSNEVSSVGWEAIHSASFISEELSSLGESIELLSELPNYAGNNICMLIHAVVNSPVDWRVDNKAALLMHSGTSVAQQYFKYILRKEAVNDVSNLLIHLSIISSRRTKCNFFSILDFLYKDDPNFFGNFKFMLRELPETFFRIALTKEAISLDEEDDLFEEDIDVYDIVKTLTDIMETFLQRSFQSDPSA